MYMRSLVEHANLNVTSFTIDAHSEAGYRTGQLGVRIQPAAGVRMYKVSGANANTLSAKRLRDFIKDAANSLT